MFNIIIKHFYDCQKDERRRKNKSFHFHNT